MVYFHSIDVVLRRTASVRQAWSSRCHLPKIMFIPKKGRNARDTSSKCYDYVLFKRMIAVKAIVYKRHKIMFRKYEKYCEEASLPKYWQDADSDEDQTNLESAEATNEVVDDEGF